MLKSFSFIIGILFCSIGLSFMFLYLNLLTIVYSFLEFVNFIFRRIECLIFIIGVIMIMFSFERWLRNELLLRYFSKFKRNKTI